MYIALLIFPILSVIISTFGSSIFGCFGASYFSSFCIFNSFSISSYLLVKACMFGDVVTFNLTPWLTCGSLIINWGFLFDNLTCVILVVVTSVSFLVHIYSISYIENDPHLNRFFSYLSLFTFFILVLVTADNLVQMFFGWEGVGLSSYLLINFWFTRVQANKAAIKAILVNRIGDFSLCIALCLIFFEFGSFDYSAIFPLIPFSAIKTFTLYKFTFSTLDIIALFLFIGSIGKSAQIGLHTWLPDAMEGPTPVSALIHAATLVTAGVFLLVRCSPIFEFSSYILSFVTFIGAITAFFAATTGLLQNDLKKVVAYSTCSQLGYMLFSCGLSSYNLGLFHLANHAFFKALLFLSAGGVIHGLRDEQDIRRIGGLVQLIPFSYSMMFIGTLALQGFPFLSGFYSKDLIIEVAFVNFNTKGYFAYYLGVLAIFFTSFYSTRLIYLTFLSKPRGFKITFAGVHESPIFISIPIFSLSFGSIFFGYFFSDVFTGLGSDFFTHVLFINPGHFYSIDAEYLVWYFKVFPVLMSFFGCGISFFFYSIASNFLFYLKMNKVGQFMYVFLNRKWFFDRFYTVYIAQFYIRIAYENTYRLLDKGLLELFGPFGLVFITYCKIQTSLEFHTGQVFHYMILIIISICFLISLVFVVFSFSTFFLIDPRMLFIFFFIIFSILLGT